MTPFDYEQARFNMVEQQIRTWDVLDQRVLDLLFAVKREDFVPPAYKRARVRRPRDAAWQRRADVDAEDGGAGHPGAHAAQPNDRVLEIGTGSGYLTALLASCAGRRDERRDRSPRSPSDAARKLSRLGFDNARVDVGDGARGFGNEAYDVIVLTGSTPLLPERFFEQLAPGGRLFAVVGEAPAMAARLIRWMRPALASRSTCSRRWSPR